MISNIYFLLPVSGGSGGAHSVMQEAEAMCRMGLNVSILVNHDNSEKLRSAYADLPRISKSIRPYSSVEDMRNIVGNDENCLVIATTNYSVHVLADVAGHGNARFRSAYYIQDYEPLFYPPSTDEWLTAYRSYGLVPGMLHFAKTAWLKEVVEANHAVPVRQIKPSIDHSVFYPDFSARTPGRKLRVAAMIRPHTRRRAPARTARILNALSHLHPDQLEIVAFGCTVDELRSHNIALFGATFLGVLKRHEVGDLFRTTDLFLDLSDYQAFGRTAVEAMSCGTISVVPAHGGAREYAVDGRNAFIVDTRDEGEILRAVKAFIGMGASERSEMMHRAVRKGFEYSTEAAALSEIELFL